MEPTERDDLLAMVIVPRSPMETDGGNYRWFAAVSDVERCGFWIPTYLFARLSDGDPHPVDNPECRTYATRSEAVDDFRDAVRAHFLP